MSSLSERFRKDPRVRARILADPGLRSKIDASLLPVKYQRARRNQQIRQRRFSDPTLVTEQKTQADLEDEARQAAEYKYGADERELQGQIDTSPQQQANIKAANDDYQARAKEIADRLANVNTAVQGQVAAAKSADETRDAANRAEIQAQQAKEAEVRGSGVDSSVSDLAAKAAAGRQNMLDTFGAQQGLQNYAAQELLGRRSLAAQNEFNTLGTQETNRRNQLARKLSALRGEKGHYRSSLLAEQRQKERDQLNIMNTLGLNRQKAEQDAVSEAASQKLSAAKYASDLDYKNRSLNSQNAYRDAQLDLAERRLTSKGSDGGGSDKKEEAIKYRADISSAAGDIKTILETARREGDKLSTSQLRTVLNKRYKDNNVVNAAMDLYYRKGLSPSNRKILTEQGYGVPKKWTQNYKPYKKKSLKDVKKKVNGETNIG